MAGQAHGGNSSHRATPSQTVLISVVIDSDVNTWNDRLSALNFVLEEHENGYSCNKMLRRLPPEINLIWTDRRESFKIFSRRRT